MSHILKDATLAVCDASKLSAWGYKHIDTLKALASRFEKLERPDTELSHAESYAMVGIRQHAPGVYSFPYLNPEFCKRLVREFVTSNYTTNDLEPESARIPELVLEEANYGVYQALRGLHKALVKPLAVVLFGQDLGECKSIQMAQYKPTNTPHGCWHSDRDSECTLVVALNDDHEGGGTDVYLGPFEGVVTVPQLPVGHAMIFNGRNYPHMGRPVTKGTRHLLVHWYNFEDEAE